MVRKIIGLLICMLLLLPSSGVFALSTYKTSKSQPMISTDEKEYWALLVGCNEFLNKPGITLPGNDLAAEDLRDLLLLSENWKSDHIQVLTGKNASWLNIMKGLFWLDKMDDEDDVDLIFITTHGMPLFGIVMFPKDEDDGSDELLITYSTYRTLIGDVFWQVPLRTHFIFDDMLSALINRMDAEGVCAIINACYCGFDDELSFKSVFPTHALQTHITRQSASEWMEGFAADLRGPNRVILLSCQEEEESLGNIFPYSVFEGLLGYGDSNNDSFCSAEEAFTYASPRAQTFLTREFNFPQHPQINDDYPGELILTQRQLPPDIPELNGPSSGTCDIEYTFHIVSNDAEGDFIKYNISWGDGTEEWTSLYPSGDMVNLSHRWTTEGTYNIWYESQDEHGANYHEFVFPEHTSITISDENLVDQQQTTTYTEQCFNDGVVSNTRWMAQSFVPTQTTLSKVNLETIVSLVNSDVVGPLHISIRDNLSGPDLTENLSMPQQIANHMIPYVPRPLWTTFDFPDITVIPGKTYYIICRFDTASIGGWWYAGKGYSHDPHYLPDPYPDGKPYFSSNSGIVWHEFTKIQDFSFVVLS